MSEMIPTGGLDAITLRNVTPGAFGLTLLAAASQAVAITALSLGTVAKTNAANVFTLAQTIQAAAGLVVTQAATQDGIALIGRAGGTLSRTVTLTPQALTGSRTHQLIDADLILAGSAAALTSGRLPFVITGGVLSSSAGLQYNDSAFNLALGDGTTAIVPVFNFSSPAGQNQELRYTTNGSRRWVQRKNNTAEGGANAGSDYALLAYDDANAVIDTPISIIRAAGGAITLARTVTCYLALSAASITATGLTAGLVPFIGTGGLLVNDSGFLYGTAVTTGVGSVGKAVSVGNGVAGANVALVLNSILTQHKVISFQDGGLLRWALADIATSAQFELRAHDVSGAYIDAPMVVVNAAGGAITLARPVTCSSTLSATSLTATGLTSGRVPYVTTGGLLTATSGLLYAGTDLTLGDGLGTYFFSINQVASGTSAFSIKVASVKRWDIYVTNTESGSDAGADLVLGRAYSDAGTGIDNPITITRASTGRIAMTRNVSVTGTAPTVYTAARTDIGGGRILTAEIGLGVAISAGNGLLQLASGTTIASAALFGDIHVWRQAASLLAIGSNTQADCSLILNSATGGNRYYRIQTAGVTRMLFGLTNSAEGGASAGSNVRWSTYQDDGTTENRIMDIVRATGGAIAIPSRPMAIGSASMIGTERLLVSGGTISTPTATDVTVGGGIIAAGASFRVLGNQVVNARKAGWTVATGTATRTAFETTTVTLTNLAERVKALIDDLHQTAGHGLIGT